MDKSKDLIEWIEGKGLVIEKGKKCKIKLMIFNLIDVIWNVNIERIWIIYY